MTEIIVICRVQLVSPDDAEISGTVQVTRLKIATSESASVKVCQKVIVRQNGYISGF